MNADPFLEGGSYLPFPLPAYRASTVVHAVGCHLLSDFFRRMQNPEQSSRSYHAFAGILTALSNLQVCPRGLAIGHISGLQTAGLLAPFVVSLTRF